MGDAERAVLVIDKDCCQCRCARRRRWWVSDDEERRAEQPALISYLLSTCSSTIDMKWYPTPAGEACVESNTAGMPYEEISCVYPALESINFAYVDRVLVLVAICTSHSFGAASRRNSTPFRAETGWSDTPKYQSQPALPMPSSSSWVRLTSKSARLGTGARRWPCGIWDSRYSRSSVWYACCPSSCTTSRTTRCTRTFAWIQRATMGRGRVDCGSSSLCSVNSRMCGQPGCGCRGFLLSHTQCRELLDTFFIVIHKKNLIFLHWYHHISVLLYCWHSYVTKAPTGIIFSCMNYAVHALMYFYYFLMAVKLKPKWFNPVWITVAQIAQMVVGVAVTISGWYIMKTKPEGCALSKENNLAALVMYGSYLFLFLQFFFGRYFAKKTKAKTI